MRKKKTCENCGHPEHDFGMQFVMRGECEHCPECDRLVDERLREDRKARPAQYREIE